MQERTMGTRHLGSLKDSLDNIKKENKFFGLGQDNKTL